MLPADVLMLGTLPKASEGLSSQAMLRKCLQAFVVQMQSIQPLFCLVKSPQLVACGPESREPQLPPAIAGVNTIPTRSGAFLREG